MRPTLRIVDNLEVGSIEGAISVDLVNSNCADPAADDGAVYLFIGSETYSYEIGFVAVGYYTLAYTCDAGLDDPEQADELMFSEAQNVSVVAGEAAVVDF
jgi:hypothetical protein